MDDTWFEGELLLCAFVRKLAYSMQMQDALLSTSLIVVFAVARRYAQVSVTTKIPFHQPQNFAPHTTWIVISLESLVITSYSTSTAHIKYPSAPPCSPTLIAPRLRRRHRLESLRNLRYPTQPRLSKDLRGRLNRPVNTLLQQTRTQHNLVVTHDFLVVVHVRSAVGAVVAVDAFA
jgi:hypothetical protein